jgi:sugar lactone lactonase YvrE
LFIALRLSIKVILMKIFRAFLLCMLFTGNASFYIQAQTITTYAGTGTAGYSLDGVAATGAELNSPFGITFNSGNLYIADRLNNRIRMVNSAGIIATIAGNGTSGFGGDGGPATAAEIADPVDVAADNFGNVYIADKSNNRIRKVDAAGNISTVAGSASSAFSGDNGPATQAALSTPRGVAVDSKGNIYISDQGNSRVRKVDNTGIITTIAGTAAAGYNGDGIAATLAQLNGPYGIAVDNTGNVFVCDVDNERIRKIDTFGMISTVAGTGTSGYNGDGVAASAAKLSEPIGVAVDGSGNVFIADGWNARIRAVGGSGLIFTVAGNGAVGFSGDGGSAMAAQLNGPYGVAVDGSGNIYIADYANNRIRYMALPTSAPIIQRASAGLKIAPNPCQGRFSLVANSDMNEPVRFVICNTLGEIVSEISSTTNSVQNISLQAPPGCYFLQAFTAHQVLSERIVIRP